MNGVWTRVKRVAALVGRLHTTLGVLAWLGSIVMPFRLTTSHTLQGFITFPSAVGGVLGYFFTVTGSAGMSRERCLRRRMKYLIVFGVSLATYVAVLIVLRPPMARRYPAVAALRELLLDAMPLPNIVVALASGLAVYFLVGAIVLSSPNMPRSRLND